MLSNFECPEFFSRSSRCCRGPTSSRSRGGSGSTLRPSQPTSAPRTSSGWTRPSGWRTTATRSSRKLAGPRERDFPEPKFRRRNRQGLENEEKKVINSKSSLERFAPGFSFPQKILFLNLFFELVRESWLVFADYVKIPADFKSLLRRVEHFVESFFLGKCKAWYF